MIFTDVLILILSLVISGRYEMVFRNAAFVIAVILIRFSLTEEPPYGAAIALLAMVFGILTLLVFNYHSGLRASELQDTRRSITKSFVQVRTTSSRPKQRTVPSSAAQWRDPCISLLFEMPARYSPSAINEGRNISIRLTRTN